MLRRSAQPRAQVPAEVEPWSSPQARNSTTSRRRDETPPGWVGCCDIAFDLDACGRCMYGSRTQTSGQGKGVVPGPWRDASREGVMNGMRMRMRLSIPVCLFSVLFFCILFLHSFSCTPEGSMAQWGGMTDAEYREVDARSLRPQCMHRCTQTV